MESITKDILKIIQVGEDKTIYDEEDSPNGKYILNKTEFENNKLMKLPCENDKYRKDILLPKYFGKYTKYYLDNINDNNNLLYVVPNKNSGILKHMIFTEENFEFITGPDKSGKTFTILYSKRFGKLIYFNLNTIYKLVDEKQYEIIKEMFFYEISQFFTDYEDYMNFSKNFIKKSQSMNVNMNEQPFSFINIFFEFIKEIEDYLNNNKSKYPKLKIIIDNINLDENNSILFKQNINLIKKLYEEKEAIKNIQFLFISPINDNYIKKCVIHWLNLIKNNYKGEMIKKDQKDGTLYFPFTFIGNCFYSNEEDFFIYKNSLFKRNDNLSQIPEKYLESLKYSIYHLNHIQLLYDAPTNDQNSKEKEMDIYLKRIEDNGNNEILYFYENYDDKELKIYKYDLDKVKEYNDLINKEIEINTLINMLPFIPIKIISFDGITNKKNKYKVSYFYNIYKTLIPRYLERFKDVNYNDNPILKGGQKGDILEEKVIKSIENGYFGNFKPDETINVPSIFNLMNYNEKNKLSYLNEINKFKSVLSQKKNKLIMITQSYSNAQRYDIAFLQKISANEFQFILGQITRKKQKKDMLQYTNVAFDCRKFSDFFNIPEINLKVSRYHFFFVFQAGIKEDKASMEFCNINRIKFYKFCVKNDQLLFSDSNNIIIKDIIFDNKSFSIVDYIKNKKIQINDDSSSSEYSVIGKKRQSSTNESNAKYLLGTKAYNKIKNILKKNYKCSRDFYSLEEDKYFHVFNKIVKDKQGNKTRFQYLVYMSYKKKIIVDLIQDRRKLRKNVDTKKYQDNLRRIISSPGFKIDCFQIIN